MKLKDNPLVSIIIRTKNEEKWINLCLSKVYEQSFKNYEIIILDNHSTDSTLKKIKKKESLRTFKIKNYLPGKSLNTGIRHSKGELIVFLSAHCIPVNKNWLSELINSFQDEKVAGVYSRQLPMKFSSDETKRELFITFGLDKKMQIKDSFFHNASSAIKKSVWKKIKFNESTTNIEDRIWAKNVQSHGYKIFYNPNSLVWHYHGIHQYPNISRLQKTVLRMKENFKIEEGSVNFDHLEISSITPFIGKLDTQKEKELEKTFDFLNKCKLIKNKIILTDSLDVMKFSKKIGFSVPFVRNKQDSNLNLNLGNIYKKYLKSFEKKNFFFDILVSVEVNNQKRRSRDLTNLILECVNKNYDSMVPVIKEYSAVWRYNNNSFIRVDDGDYAKLIKQPLLVLKKDFAIITRPSVIRDGKLIGKNNGFYFVND
jgi:glycosyltransferase involved in cell wall biosynthesis